MKVTFLAANFNPANVNRSRRGMQRVKKSRRFSWRSQKVKAGAPLAQVYLRPQS